MAVVTRFKPRRRLPRSGPPIPGEQGYRQLLATDTGPHAYLVSPNADRTTGGSNVTIKGTQFQTSADGLVKPTVRFGATLGTGLVLVDSETITVNVPAGVEGLVDITITNPNGQTSILEDAFTYFATAISGIEPTHGPIAGGTTVLISGANFTSVPVVTIGGAPVTASRIDSQRIVITTPPHAQGQVIIAVDGVEARDRFFYTLLTRGEDFRRNPSVNIDMAVDGPASMTFTVDGTSAPPRVNEEIEYRDDAGVLLFAGVVQIVEMAYEELPEHIVWNVTASDYTPWLNRRRPTGEWVYTSATTVVKAIMQQVAPWATTNHVQTGLPLISIRLDGTDDTATALTKIARLLGNGYWRFDFIKDLHFILSAASIRTVPPTPVTAPGGGEVNPTSVTLVQSSTKGTMRAGYVGIFVAFKYANGVVSALGPMSDLVLFDGTKLPTISNIPIGASVGGVPVVSRQLFYKWFGVNGGTTLSAFAEVADNVTTSITSSPLQVNFTVPRLPSSHPPAIFRRAPSADQAGESARSVLGLIYPELYGASGSIKSYNFSAGTWAFKISANFDDGTESQWSEASSPVYLDGSHAVHFSTNNHGDDVGAASVMFWKVYGSKASTRGGTPNWDQASTTLWTVIPGNTNGTYNIAPSVKDRDITNVSSSSTQITSDASTSVPPPPNPPLGPNPEDAHDPSDLVDNHPYLLPGIKLTIDGTQVRNRVIVYGPPKVDPPPIQIPPTPAATSFSQSGSVDPYLGAYPQGMGRNSIPPNEGQRPIEIPVVYLNSHQYLGQWKGYPVNRRWADFFNANQPGIIRYNGIPFTYDAKWLEHAGMDKSFVESHPFTAFMDLPDDYYEPGGGAGIPATIAVVDNSQTQTTQDTQESNANVTNPIRRNHFQFDDLDSQRYFASIELNPDGTPSDGIHEVIIDPGLPSDAECMAFAQAQLAQFAWPLSRVTYPTREPTYPGTTVHIDLTDPPIKGDFLITHVSIDQIKDEAATTFDLYPRFNVTASDPVKFDFDDLLLAMGGGGIDVFGGGGGNGGISTDLLAGLGIGGGGPESMAAMQMLIQRSTAVAAGVIGNSLSFKVSTRTFSVGEVAVLSNVGPEYEIAPAVPGYFLAPVFYISYCKVGATPFNIASVAFSIYWQGTTGNNAYSPSLFANGTNTIYRNFATSTVGFSNASQPYGGKGLYLKGTGVNSPGAGSFLEPLTIAIGYAIVPFSTAT